ncbi:MAG: hypothetical protein QNJ77_00995 [Acidimicrobiia bacterium]|nr:hypothetical protein [Acidimicrobiia bacterium]
MVAPRIYCIPATAAAIVAVVRRGPSDWVHVGAWHTDEGRYEPGAWFHGVIYPQKCDLSPDGRWLLYSAMKVGSAWPAGDIYEAVSRLPWLTALAAWNSGTTYTRGMHFIDDPAESDAGHPDVGEARPLLRRYGLRWTLPGQYAVERRRGWVESADSPSPGEGDWWDERRRAVMTKRQPQGRASLFVEGRYAAFRTGEPSDEPPVYWLETGDDMQLLDDVQWADWDEAGRLLVATAGGLLETRSLDDGATHVIADVSAPEPDPRPPPAWAEEW